MCDSRAQLGGDWCAAAGDEHWGCGFSNQNDVCFAKSDVDYVKSGDLFLFAPISNTSVSS